jgi:hypothetical protein
MDTKLNLFAIAEWQFLENPEVILPKMQRGFVWDPEKIECLWDSLLRRYPVGSFLFSKTEDRHLLLDGQQRATAIALGFFNPFADKMNPWSIKEDGEHLPVVWIDINPTKKNLPEGYKFLIRVVTRSHPWGYTVSHDRLGINERKEALKLFKKCPQNQNSGYTQFKNTTYFPFDAWYPVPLSFFINAIKGGCESKETVSQAVIELCNDKLPEYIHTQKNKFKNKVEFIEKLDGALREKLDGISQKILDAVNNTVINYDALDEAVLNEEDNIGEQQDTFDEAENPTLFVRINSGGEPLSGDDLIYSIYKAAFPKSKELVENIGQGFIPPTQIISIASRIAYSDRQKETSYPGRMTVSGFQNHIKIKPPNKSNRFRDILNSLIGTKDDSPLGKHFQSAIEILSLKGVEDFDSESHSEIPPVLIKEFIKKSPDLFLFLIYWLHKNEVSVEISADLKKKIVARLFVFSWFTYDRSKRTIEKTVKEIWKHGVDRDFWEQPINTVFESKDDPLLSIPVHPDLLMDYYFSKKTINHFFAGKDDKWNLLECTESETIKKFLSKNRIKTFTKASEWEEALEANFQQFIENLTSGWSLVLLAQRAYINEQFKDFNQLDDVDDTNAPWDWDHIYPDNWTKRQLSIVKEWNETIGNYRVLALEQNRSQNDGWSPSKRLSDLPDNDPPLTGEQIRKLSFVNDDWDYWKDITQRIKNGDRQDILKHYKAVVTRMLNIYKRFWNDLQIWETLGLKK